MVADLAGYRHTQRKRERTAAAVHLQSETADQASGFGYRRLFWYALIAVTAIAASRDGQSAPRDSQITPGDSAIETQLVTGEPAGVHGLTKDKTTLTNLSSDITFDDFVGAKKCGACHMELYARWQESTHGKAGGPPSQELVISDFDGTTLHFSNASVDMEVDENGQFIFHVDRPGSRRQSFAVAGVVGGGHLLGGGTQTSFAQYSDGSWRLLPFDYSRQSNLWFCDTRGNRGWLPITEKLPIEACIYWPPVNNFAANCGNCHSSQMTSEYDAQTESEEVQFSSLAINCESCHGPGRRHSELMASSNRGTLADIGMEPLELLGKNASVQVCFRCHALTQKLAPGYLPGKRFEEYYGLYYFPEGRRTPDGRVLGFGYQEGHLYSDCYLSGSMTCVDCHDPHSQSYRDVDGFPLPGKLDDGQCLDCHPSKATDIQAHTGHHKESAGSRCVACHMPFLQHEAVGKQVRFARSDHTIPVPRPTADAAAGLETACAACHPDRPVLWQQAQLNAWHGAAKPRATVVQELLALQASGDRDVARQALGRAYATHPAAEFDLLRLAGRILRLESTAGDVAVRARLEQLALNLDLEIGSLAWAYLLASDDVPVEANGPLPDNIAQRRRIALWLRLWGISALQDGSPAAAVTLLEQSRRFDPAQVPTYLALADALSITGKPPQALETLRGAARAGLSSRDQYLQLVAQICTTFDSLMAQGMQSSASIVSLCDDAQRQPALPLANQ